MTPALYVSLHRFENSKSPVLGSAASVKVFATKSYFGAHARLVFCLWASSLSGALNKRIRPKMARFQKLFRDVTTLVWLRTLTVVSLLVPESWGSRGLEFAFGGCVGFSSPKPSAIMPKPPEVLQGRNKYNRGLGHI